MTKKEKKIVSFGSSVKAEAKTMQKQKVETKLTLENTIENISINTAKLFTEHADVLNCISFWIAEQDAKVKEEGNVVLWAHKVTKERERLTQRQLMDKANRDWAKDFPNED